MDMQTDKLVEELVCHSGVEYKTFMQRVAAHFGAKRYLEIGTQNGVSLAMMPCDSIAIDPAFSIDRVITSGKQMCLLFQMSSDRFFAQHDPSRLLGGPIEIAFLDGMHRFEYLLRDFANIERFCNRNSIIFLHDCLPPIVEMTVRQDKAASLSEKYKGYWTGDVWKVVPLLKRHRPDLSITLINCPPTGLVACTNLDPENKDLQSKYFEMVREATTDADDYDRIKSFYASQELKDSKKLSVSEELTKHFWL